jgi:hypothetical protein
MLITNEHPETKKNNCPIDAKKTNHNNNGSSKDNVEMDRGVLSNPKNI